MFISLDPSLSSTGYCVMNRKNKIIKLGKIVPHKKKTEEEKISLICTEVDEIIKEFHIKEVFVEDQFLHKNAQTLMKLSRLRGAIIFVAMANNCKIESMSPAGIRCMLMGNGAAKKEEVAEYIKKIYKDESQVRDLGEFCDRTCKAKNSDIFDAIAIALAFKRII